MQFGRTKTIKIYAKKIPELKEDPCFGIPEILQGTAWRDFEASWHWGQYSLGLPVALDVESMFCMLQGGVEWSRRASA